MNPGKWTTEFLQALRQQGDPAADACFAQLRRDHTIADASALFQAIRYNDAGLPSDAPEPLRDFFAHTQALPPDTDQARISRGEVLFMTHAFPAALALLVKSLPSGYAALNLAQILNLSGELLTHPYRRLLGVLQMVVNVSTCRGFQAAGEAVVTAQKLRLLHAGIRHIARAKLPDYEARYGVPVNQEDMLATIMGFSYLVIVGLRQLSVGLSPSEEEDFYYLWRIYARLMGIQPDAIPDSVADAGAFYDVYCQRHYVEAADNPDGVALAVINVKMLEEMIPPLLRRLGLGLMPRIYMQDLLGAAGCRRVGVQPVSGHRFWKALLRHLPGMWMGVWTLFDRRGHRIHEALSQMMFQGMINRAYDGQVTFVIPASLADVRALVERPAP